jgi:hypothetical protein
VTRVEGLEKALKTLTPRQRFVIENSWGLDGREVRSFRELAELMGVNVHAIHDQYRYGMKRLAKTLNSYPLLVEGYFPEEEPDRTGQILSGQIPYSDLSDVERAGVDEILNGFGETEDDYSEDSFP